MKVFAGVLIGGLVVYALLAFLSFLTVVGIVLLVPILTWGYTLLVLNALDGDVEFNDLFEGFQRYGETLVDMLAYHLTVLMISIPTLVCYGLLIAFEDERFSTLAFFVSTALHVLVLYRLQFVPFFLVDTNCRGFDAVRAAWDLTKQNKAMSVLLAVVASIVANLGVLLLCVGVVFTIPLAQLMWAAAYRQLMPLPDDESHGIVM